MKDFRFSATIIVLCILGMAWPNKATALQMDLTFTPGDTFYVDSVAEVDLQPDDFVGIDFLFTNDTQTVQTFQVISSSMTTTAAPVLYIDDIFPSFVLGPSGVVELTIFEHAGSLRLSGLPAPEGTEDEIMGIGVWVQNTVGQIWEFHETAQMYDERRLYSIEVETTEAPIPEPATMLLFGTGLAGLAGYRRRQAKKK